VQDLHPARHRALNSFYLTPAVEEATLESKHCLAALAIDGGANDEQAV